MLGASRMSSVPGLNASPRSAIVLPGRLPRWQGELLQDASPLEVVHLDDGGGELKVVAGVARQLLERRRVLREAAPAVTHAGSEEVRPEAVVEADDPGDVDDVGVHELADIGDFVDEADPRYEESVRRELRHLRRVDVGPHNRRVDLVVERLDEVAVVVVEGADDDAVGLEEDGTAVPSAVNSGFDT